MRKEIIVNANKDRARIAIVEDGQLVELYVENPDNVRTLGNIVLGKVQKVKPEIKAAFVDIGQKQDAFLHFSDLTDNLPALLSLAGEDIPGLDIPVLQTRPKKRVADDESEADVEEKLEVADTSEDESQPQGRRRRRRRGGSGRGRGGRRRREEEEEQEEKPRPGFMVLDLTGGTSKPAPKRSEPKPEKAEAANDEAPADEAKEEKPKRGRSRRSKTSDEPQAEDAPATAESAGDAAEPKAPSSRRRSKKAGEPQAAADPQADAPAQSETKESDEKPKRSRRRSKKTAEPVAEADTAEPKADEQKADEKPTRSRRKKKADAEQAEAPTPEEAPAGSADEKPKRGRRKKKSDDAAGRPEAGADEPKADDEPPKRGRRRSKSGDGAQSDRADEQPAAEQQDESQDEREPKGRRGRRSKKADAPKDEEAAEQRDAQAEPEAAAEAEASDDAADEQPKRRGRRQRRSRRSRSEDSSPAEASQDEKSAEREETDEQADDRESGRGRRRGRRSRSDSGQEGQPEAGAQDADADDEKADDDSGRGRRSRRSRGGRSRSGETSDGGDDREAQPSDREDSDDSSDGGRRPGRRSRRKKDDAQAASADAPTDSRSDDEKEEQDDARRSGRGRRGRGRGDGDAQKGDDAKDAEDDRKGRDGGRSGRGRGRSNGRSAKGDSSSKDAAPSSSPINLTPSGPQKAPHEYVRRGQAIPVKITKEPISAKGSRVSTDTSLAGRFLVLVPLAEYVAVSKKIESSKERRRLKTLASSLKPDGFGVIVRTVAAGRDAKSLDTDLRLLLDKWRKIEKQLRSKPKPPHTLYEDVNMVSSILRDLFSEDYDRILIDDPALFQKVRAYVQAVAPQMVDAVQPYRGNVGVFRSAGIEKQVQEAFSTRVNLRSGGYLFIETTEAMHVVDVNSGRSGRGKSQVENLLAVNIESAREVAKQLRLRDLGGIIVVDFIDMRSEAHRKQITDALKEEFKKDRAVTKFLPMSDFGLVQITRQRLRPSITAGDADGQEAQEAAGAGEIAPSNAKFKGVDEDAIVTDASIEIEEPQPEPTAERASKPAAPAGPRPSLNDLVGQIETWLKRYRSEVDEKFRHRPLLLRVHPLLASHLQRGLPSRLLRWRLQMPTPKLRLDLDEGMDPLAFDVLDEKSGRPLTKKYRG